MGKLPDSFVSEYKSMASGTRVMGIPVEELNRDELLAAIGALQEQHSLQMEMNDRRLQFEQSLRRCKLEIPSLASAVDQPKSVGEVQAENASWIDGIV